MKKPPVHVSKKISALPRTPLPKKKQIKEDADQLEKQRKTSKTMLLIASIFMSGMITFVSSFILTFFYVNKNIKLFLLIFLFLFFIVIIYFLFLEKETIEKQKKVQ